MKPFIIKMLFCTLVLLNFQVSAHHSAVVFDETKTQLIKGEVTRFVLRNPHMILSVDVPDENGELVEWKLEGQGIGAMQAMGFDRGSISAGDNITVKISLMRNGTPGGLVLGLIGADGRAYNMEVEEEDMYHLLQAKPGKCGKKKPARHNCPLFPMALLREKIRSMEKPWERWIRITLLLSAHLLPLT